MEINKWQKDNVLKGLCRQCGHNPISVYSKSRCAVCLEKSRIKQQRKKEDLVEGNEVDGGIT